jgi:hypothetical protein
MKDKSQSVCATATSRQRQTTHCTTDGYQIRRGSIAECLRHSPHSPDLAPTDYYFFPNLDNFLQEKKFNSDGAVKITSKDFIDSRPNGFFSKGINELPMRWQKCIDNDGSYFD